MSPRDLKPLYPEIKRSKAVEKMRSRPEALFRSRFARLLSEPIRDAPIDGMVECSGAS